MDDADAAIDAAVRAAVAANSLRRTAATTLSHGLPGTALFLAALSWQDPALVPIAADQWQQTADLMGSPVPDGLYTGPGALAASLIIGSGYLPASRTQHTAVEQATDWLCARAQGLAIHQQRRLRSGTPGAPWGVYDAIKGLAGIGRVLLAAEQTGQRNAAPGLTAALTTLTDMINAPARPLPGWWLPAQDHALPVAGTLPPSGAATTGLAHGLAGPLALLATAAINQRSVPGQDQAIATACDWLLKWRNPNGTWPAHIPGDALRRAPDPRALAQAPGRRDAWCYGAAGIGRALTLAGQALADRHLQQTGHHVIDTIAQRAADQWDTTGPGLCHGSAGVLQAALRNTSTTLQHQAADRTVLLLHTALSHKHAEPAPLDDVGFLEGTSGAALALADHQGWVPESVHSPWDALLLLS